MGMTTIEGYLCAMPKAELHVHLEGSIQPATLFTLAQRNGVRLPVETVADLQKWFTFRDFNHFVEIYFEISSWLKTSEDYEMITYEFGTAMAQQNVRYAEVTFSPSTHRYGLGVTHDTYFSGLERERERARADFGVEIRWVFDIVRDIKDEARSRMLADYTTSVAIEGKDDGVVALGLGGAEVGPTSNLRLGVYADLAEHPFPRLHEARIPVTVNSDDPPLFNTTLNDEVKLLVDPFKFDLQKVNEIVLNGVRHSFLPVEEKQAMEASFQIEMARLQHVLAL